MDGETWKISTNKYPGAIHPRGFEHQEAFKLDPLPTFVYSIDGIELRKRIFMPYRKNAVVVNYRFSNIEDRRFEFSVRPLINNRGIDEIVDSEYGLGFSQSADSTSVKIRMRGDDEPFMYLGSDSLIYRISGLPEEEKWYRNMEYAEERKRGFEYRENHYNPGSFETILYDGLKEFNILATAGAGAKKAYDELYAEEKSKFDKLRRYSVGRMENLYKKFSPSVFEGRDDIFESLFRASDSFLVDGGNIMAGYHWFSTWGRDSLIALPGLTLVQGRNEEAKEVLLSIGDLEKGGLIPNIVGLGEPEYNSVDAALLYFYSLFKYLVYTDDLSMARKVWGTLENIIENFFGGIDGKVKVNEDGLVWCCGGMTWMDARVDGECVTPREGKPVEINALWYNALKIFEILSEKLDRENRWEGVSGDVRRKFVEKFWNSDGGYLYDLINAGCKDDKVRPNQIFALSLPFTLLERNKATSVISTVRDELLTPYGLRSLSKDSSDFVESYSGDITAKDRAYHQGTVWTWLFGPYATALKNFRSNFKVRKFVERTLEPFLEEHLRNSGIGTVSEVFDGDEPYNPGGCISQAWSVGEIIRSYVEDFKGVRPQFESRYR